MFAYALSWIFFFICVIISKAIYKKRRAEAAQKDKAHRDEYEKQKAIAEIELSKKRAALAEEVATNVKVIEERITPCPTYSPWPRHR